MKRFKKFILILLILPFTYLFAGCSLDPYIVSFEKTSSTGSTDTYTLTYSNGEKSYFTVENGKDGSNGTSLTLQDIKQYCEEENISLEDFFKNNLNLEVYISQTKQATNLALQSAVSIFAENSSGAYAGSGVIYRIDDDFSYIITNHHVTHAESSSLTGPVLDKITIYTYGENEKVYKDNKTNSYIYTEGAIECEYVGGSDRYDIAVIKAPTNKILENNPSACAAKIAKDYSIADTVVAIGNPSGRGLSATQGIISVESEKIKLYYDNYYYKELRVMRIDAAVNGGNSGGGLFNTAGELVGIVNAKINRSDIENIAYAIPYNTAINVAESIIYNNKLTGSNCPTQAKFGVTYTETNFRSVYDKNIDCIKLYNDIIVDSISNESSLASRIGFEINDIIKSATVKRGSTETTYTFNRSFDLLNLCLTLRAGDSINFVVNRNGTDITIGSLENTIITNSDLILCDTTADYVKP